EAAIRISGVPVQVVSCGLPCLLVPVATRQQVDDAILDRGAFNAYAEGPDPADCVFFFSTERGGDSADAYSRMFAPELGVGEDPATGSASGPLGCYLAKHGRVSGEQAGAMLGRRGCQLGRPGELQLLIAGD